jgi:hypothetical protein
MFTDYERYGVGAYRCWWLLSWMEETRAAFAKYALLTVEAGTSG